MSNWKLLIEDDAGKTIVVPVARDIITIGRKDGNTIRLTERNVSRFHAKLVRESGTVFIEDLESYNGVKLNGDRIKGRVEIQEGDLIEIGDYHLALQNEDLDALPTEPPMEATAKLSPHPGGQLPPPAAQPSQDDYEDDDQFAGDTQRWEPPSSMEPVAVGGGGATVNDQAPVGLGPDIPTTDDTVPLPSPAAGPSSPPDAQVDLDQTIRNPSAPNMAAPSGPLSATSTQPFAPTPSGSDEASGDFLPPPGASGPVLPTPAPSANAGGLGFDPSSDATQPLVPPSQSAPVIPPPSNGMTAPSPAQPATGAPIAGPSTPFGQSPPATAAATPQPLGQASGKPSLADDLDQTAAVPRAGTDATQSHRLVAVNTVFAGSVFPLRREEIIIGRVEDNDLVIEHRSVSRSHAKLVKEGDGYAIVDLKSANGVLVNGDEVSHARLKSGDIIELGRVRLRFVPVGEMFSLSEDEIQRARIADTQGDDFNEETATALRGRLETPTPSAKSGNPNTMLLVAFGAIIVLLLIVIVILLTRGGSSGTVSGDVILQPAIPLTDEMSEEEKEATARENEGLLTEAESLWADLQADGNVKAEAALARIRNKIADNSRWAELKDYRDEEDWANVLLLADQFSAQSAYAEKVQEARVAAKAAQVAITVGRVTKAIEDKDWSEAESALGTLAKETKKQGPYEELSAALQRARAEAEPAADEPDEVTTTSTRRPPRGGRASRANKRSGTKRGKADVADKREPEAAKPEREIDTKGAERALAQATQLLLNGATDQALRKAQEAKRLDPKYNATNRVLGTIYRQMGKNSKAVSAYKAYLRNGGVTQADKIRTFIDEQG